MSNSLGSRVLIIDDQVGEIRWLVRRIQQRGYHIELATNERDARRALEKVAVSPELYAAGIFDIMVAIMDLESLLEIGDDVDLATEVLAPSTDTGLRLSRFARNELELGPDQFPIAALSVRNEDALKKALAEVSVALYSREEGDDSETSIMRFLDLYLPQRPPED